MTKRDQAVIMTKTLQESSSILLEKVIRFDKANDKRERRTDSASTESLKHDRLRKELGRACKEKPYFAYSAEGKGGRMFEVGGYQSSSSKSSNQQEGPKQRKNFPTPHL